MVYLCVVCVIFVCVCVVREDSVVFFVLYVCVLPERTVLYFCVVCVVRVCVLPERQCCNFVLSEKTLWYLCC